MKSIYELIGRLVVAFIRRRYGRTIGVVAIAALAAGIGAVYLFGARDVEEG